MATAFPSGRASLPVKLADTALALDGGATEIDMVIDRGAWLTGRYGQVHDEIVAVRELVDGRAHLKVILETGELPGYDDVRRAAWLALLAGADVVKTSTGKTSPAATLPVVQVLLQAVRDWHRLTGERRGVKAAGGIRRAQDAVRHLVAVREVAGPEWLTPALFRFGASSLLDDLLRRREHSRPDGLGLRGGTGRRGGGEAEAGLLAVRRRPVRRRRRRPADACTTRPRASRSPRSPRPAAPTSSARSPRRAGRRSTGARCPARARTAAVPPRAGGGRPRATSWPCWRRWTPGGPSASPRRPVRRRRAPALVRRLGGQAGVRRLRPRPAAGGRASACSSRARCPPSSGRVAPALACGNAVVLVPDPDAPLGALVLAEAAAEAGLPDGRAQRAARRGARRRRRRGRRHRVRPPSAGRRRGSCRAAPVARETTGGLAQVVHDDAPLDQAVDGIVEALGDDQRVLVAESVADEFGELLRERLARLRVGDPLDHNTDLGPMSSPQRRDRAVALATAADDEGARRWTSPARLPERGWFLAPTVFTDVAPTMRVAREEIPGPLLPVLTFRTPAEAVATAGAPRAAAVWTDKGSRALWTAQRLRAGVVWVNAFNRVDPTAASALRRVRLRPRAAARRASPPRRLGPAPAVVR